MEVTRINDNAFQLTRFGLVNCYLVRENDGFTLIDTGLPGSADDILAAASAAGDPIRRILLTHAHSDHVGSVDALIAKLPAASVTTSERSLPLLKKPADKSLWPGEPNESFAGGLPGITTPVTHFVSDNELFGSLRAISTPGHIPGHFAFFDERDGTLYAGDELQSVVRLAINGWNPWYFQLPRWVMWSKKLCLQSARRLAEYPIQRYACGHGALCEDGPEALRKLIHKAS